MPGWATRKTAEEIRRLVRLGKAREGGQLPSERDLATALQVSRATVRAALRILRDEGEIETRSGRSSGTFVSKSNPYWCLYSRTEDAVARPAVPHPMGIPQGVDESIALGGCETESTVLEARRVRADYDIARCLELPESSDVLQLRRLRKADGEGIVLECAYLPCEKFKGILEKDLAQSLYGLMKGEFGVRIKRISEVLEVVLAYVLICIAVLAYLGYATENTIALFAPAIEVPWWVCAIAWWAAIAFLGYRNIDLSSKVLGVFLVLEVLSVTILDVAIIGTEGSEGLSLAPFSPSNFLSGVPGLGLM